jgi:predicted RNA methylase
MDNKTFSPFGIDMFGDQIIQKKNGALAERFEFPPFSVLNARDGLWQDRKRAWLELGIKSEIGREAVLTGGNAKQWQANNGATGELSTWTSTFDPVICELMYKWFCPECGQVVDPFAGGSVRGIVAGLLGYKYYGIDLRQEQIDANEAQKKEICPDATIQWVCGDAMERLRDAPSADFIFSCPPYGDLERYSDDPSDLSTMDYPVFISAYKKIIAECAKKLNPRCMACFVVGDFRDKKTGFYRGFVADTIKAFQECGLGLYNDAILITCVGSLPIRVGKQFESGKKLGKTHQNILVFKK